MVNNKESVLIILTMEKFRFKDIIKMIESMGLLNILTKLDKSFKSVNLKMAE
jgi:hypothetical protein